MCWSGVRGARPCPRVIEPAVQRGAPCAMKSVNPEQSPGTGSPDPAYARTGQWTRRLRWSSTHRRASVFVGIRRRQETPRTSISVPLRTRSPYSRDGPGLDELVHRLQVLQPELIVLEATGGFEIIVTRHAGRGRAAGWWVVNPRQIRDFARACGQLAKTDTLDAAVIALLPNASARRCGLCSDEATRQLGELAARAASDRGDDQRPRASGGGKLTSSGVQKRLDAHIGWLQKELSGIETDIDAAVRESPLWREQEALLTSVPGVAGRWHAPCWPNCRSWVSWLGVRWRHWLALRRET